MKFSITLSIAAVFVYSCTIAQEVAIDTQKEELNSSMNAFIELQQKQLASHLDSIKENIDPNLEITPEDLGILRRLKSISKDVPLEFNSQVRVYIGKYASQNYRPYMNRLLGLSQHYFSIYETVFEEARIPEEIKYLSLVESSLNPHLVSTSGAVGPWQFMYATAKFYDLEMNSNIDERKDAYAASYAVARYINEAHTQFNDWLLALASYNCGRGCVQRAIQRSGFTNPSFWELAPFLPKETQNYIPKYIAMTYVLSNADYYGIEAETTELQMESKLIMVDKKIALTNVAEAIGVSLDQLKKYNPAFKQNVVVGSVEKPRRLLLPITENTNDSLLYLALNEAVLPQQSIRNEEVETKLAVQSQKKYKVKSGETLVSVSRKLGVSVQDLVAWNGLSSKSKVVGRVLVVEKPVDSRLAENVKTAAAKRKNTSVVYTVQRGDSLDRIANKFSGSSVSKLKADNGLKSDMIKPGMKLKINKG
ncbi:LysM peptidoglycan-binding domain-containing protein [Sphingobacterium yanglingense]|uniref:Membrane-bound lytic murein transglycosylase D n=1 Tax=Sphingobacterium yanglingense TaxID=1437280 RepID=A0A4R6WEM1_9SPHI|nr:LysM peptidoglycan-binding domain-containing protein [Sphingobacterium yanglingense]TDQ76437.1 membrane-bound lytic murein transglycosylase D [Sphingobacterium yanglingense]